MILGHGINPSRRVLICNLVGAEGAFLEEQIHTLLKIGRKHQEISIYFAKNLHFGPRRQGVQYARKTQHDNKKGSK
jgi:hypothetical protein